MSTERIYINGRFLTQPLSGVQRYATEIVRALDTRLADPERPRHPGPLRRFTLVVPKGTAIPFSLSQIDVLQMGRARGHLWEQIDLMRVSAGGRLLSLANAGPLFHPRHHLAIHDMSVYRHPDYYSRAYRLYHQWAGRILSRTARLLTVSEFSRRELAEVLHLDPASIVVAPNGWQHLARGSEADPPVVTPVDGAPYFVMVGNLSPNKNMRTAIAAVSALPPGAARLVIIGRLDPAVFGRLDLPQSDAIEFAGRLDDDAMASLIRGARALIFPSLYEGFGIPPLEAIRLGVRVVSSAIPAVQEVCGDTVDYFEPLDVAALTAALEGVLAEPPEVRADRIARSRQRLELYSWARSADIILDALG